PAASSAPEATKRTLALFAAELPELSVSRSPARQTLPLVWKADSALLRSEWLLAPRIAPVTPSAPPSASAAIPVGRVQPVRPAGAGAAVVETAGAGAGTGLAATSGAIGGNSDAGPNLSCLSTCRAASLGAP